MVGESTESVGAGVGGGSSSNKMPTLEEYGTNLTKLAEDVSSLFGCWELLALSHCPCYIGSIAMYFSQEDIIWWVSSC